MKHKRLFALIAAGFLAVAAVFAAVTVVSADNYNEGSIAGTTGKGTKSSPVAVSTYAQLKAALQSPDVQYVEVVSDIIYDLKYCHQAEHLEAHRNNTPHPGDYHYDRSTDSCSYSAIRIRACSGEKHLKLSGNIVIGLEEKNCQFLRSLMTFYGYGDETLYIEGPGSISGEFNDNVQTFGGSVISVEGTGNLNVAGAKIYSQAVFYNFGANAVNLDTTGRVVFRNSEFYGSHFTKDKDFANEIVFGSRHYFTAAVRVGSKCSLDISGCTFGALKGTNVKVTGLAFANHELAGENVRISDSHFETGIGVMNYKEYDGSAVYNSTSFVYASVAKLAANNNVPYGYEAEKSGVTVSELVYSERPEVKLSFISGGKTYDENEPAISLNSGKYTVRAELRIPEALAKAVSAEDVTLTVGLPEYGKETLTYGKKMPEKRAGENYRTVELTYNASFYFDTNNWENNHRRVTFTPGLKSNLCGEQLYGTTVDRLVMIKKPVYPVTGNIYYTDNCYYGKNLTTAVSARVNNSAVSASELKYQWQRFDSGKWTDIAGATKNIYKPTASDVGKQIRLTVTTTREYCEGTLIGSAMLVGKAPQEKPAAAKLTTSAPYTGFTVSDFDSSFEYVYSTDTPNDSNAGEGTRFVSKSVNGLTSGRTYYVYARRAETATHRASAWSQPSVIVLSAEVWLRNVRLCDTPGGTPYADYGKGNTIYMKAGETKVLYIDKYPAGANKWYNLTFRQENNAATDIVFTPNTSVAPNMPQSIKITAAKKGTYTIGAYKPGNNDSVGRWSLVVYSDVSEISPSQITIVDAPQFNDVTLCIGDSIPAPGYGKITARPAGALDGYTFEWRVMKPAAGTTGTPSYVTDNGYISVDKSGRITGKAANGSANAYYGIVVLCAVKGGNVAATISSYRATVSEKQAVPLERLEVSPAELTLYIGGSGTVNAILTPANPTGVKVEYLSGNSSIVSVDKNGNIKAHKAGKIKINVRAGTKMASCTVTVVDPSHEHKLGKPVDAGNGMHYAECTVEGCAYRVTEAHECSAWKRADDASHTGNCVCGARVTKPHMYAVASVSLPTLASAGSETHTCTVCGDKKTVTLGRAEPINSVSVSVPVPEIGAEAGIASADEEYCIVTDTEWSPADDVFGDKEYTVTVSLSAVSARRFAPGCRFLICGQEAELVSPESIPDEGSADIKLRLTFQRQEEGKYRVIVSGGRASHALAEPGQTVTVKAEIPDGREFIRWDVISGGVTLADAESPETTFVMQDQNAEIKAVFADIGHKHTPGGEWIADSESHRRTCTVCGSETDVSAHEFVWVTDKEATASGQGMKHEECTVCGFKRSENTPIPETQGKTKVIIICAACALLAAAAAAVVIIIIKRKKKQREEAK